MEKPCRHLVDTGRSSNFNLMFPRVDTKNASAVSGWVQQKFGAAYQSGPSASIDRLFHDVGALFAGKHPDYSAVDLRYHDLEHTLQATVCLAELLEGCQRFTDAPKITARQFELGIAAVMLHDAGYLKLRSDRSGTGAKYTFCHVLRSCAYAASYLPTWGAKESEVGAVLSAINCTGPTKEISRLHFRDATERFIGSALASADYLGQMSALDYPDELGILFAEFAESDDFIHVPANERLFASAEDLIARTPGFWRHVVLPKLENEFQGAYRYLADPIPNGTNVYLDAVTRNIALIEQHTAAVVQPVR
ncbi:MAG TPA: hypothetical protein VL069_06020 [Opitutus sp.]|nr:hypothetical protein [Opitutus sp.]